MSLFLLVHTAHKAIYRDCLSITTPGNSLALALGKQKRNTLICAYPILLCKVCFPGPFSPKDGDCRHDLRVRRLLSQIISFSCVCGILLRLLPNLVYGLPRLLWYLPTTFRLCPQSWQKLSYSRLIFFVLWVLFRRYSLGEPCASLEQNKVGQSANHSPVIDAVCDVATPLIECEPESLLGGKIGMPGP